MPGVVMLLTTELLCCLQHLLPSPTVLWNYLYNLKADSFFHIFYLNYYCGCFKAVKNKAIPGRLIWEAWRFGRDRNMTSGRRWPSEAEGWFHRGCLVMGRKLGLSL